VNGWQQKIIAFKVAHVGELPEQMEANMRQLDRLSGEVGRAGPSSSGRHGGSAQRPVLLRNGGDTEVGRAQATAEQLEQQLAAAKTQYTEDHPEVLRLTRELKAAAAGATRPIPVWGSSATSEPAPPARSRHPARHRRAGEGEKQTYQAGWTRPRAGRRSWPARARVRHRQDQVPVGSGRKVEAEIAQEIEARNAPAAVQPGQPGGAPGGPAKPDRFGGLMVVLVAALGAGCSAG
jgi:hypothetical protein